MELPHTQNKTYNFVESLNKDSTSTKQQEYIRVQHAIVTYITSFNWYRTVSHTSP